MGQVEQGESSRHNPSSQEPFATSLRPAWAIKTLSQITNKHDWKKNEVYMHFLLEL